MCIIILNTNDKIEKDRLKTCWNENPDGAGMMYTQNNELKIFKELKDFQILWNKYSEIRDKQPLSNIVLHFRIKTHGKVNTKNVHPFRVNKDLAFCHNGILSCVDVPTKSKVSDTIILNETILKLLPEEFIVNDAIRTLLEEFIGHNKLVFLDSFNNYHIINESLGHWENKNWYSNYSYIETKSYGWKDYYSSREDGTGYNSYKDYCFNCYTVLETELELKEMACEQCLIKEGYYTQDEIDFQNECETLQHGELVSSCEENLKYKNEFKTEEGKTYFYDEIGNKWFVKEEE
jgi:predicted glutamine amidotransferase